MLSIPAVVFSPRGDNLDQIARRCRCWDDHTNTAPHADVEWSDPEEYETRAEGAALEGAGNLIETRIIQKSLTEADRMSRFAHFRAFRSIRECYFSRKLEQIRRMNDQGRDVVNLGIGSPDLPPSDEAIQAAVRAIQLPGHHGYAPYRYDFPAVRSAIAGGYALPPIRIRPGCPKLRVLPRCWFQKKAVLHLDGVLKSRRQSSRTES